MQHSLRIAVYARVSSEQQVRADRGLLETVDLQPHIGAGGKMAGAYSTDLRERVLMAVEDGESPAAVAERFMVGRASVYRWVTAARNEGRRAPKPMNGGPMPVIRDEIEAALLRILEDNNHLTLAECRDRLAEATGVRVDPWTVGRALRRLHWT